MKLHSKPRLLLRRAANLLIDLSGDDPDRTFTLRRTRQGETAEERAIRQYVEGQSIADRDDRVLSVVLVKRHRYMGRSYEVFDVRCSRSRWWVITNPTNLYTQSEFWTPDYALTFHIGLFLRMWEMERVPADNDALAVSDRAWRKFGDAAEALSDANDIEDYQTVGVRLREAMIALVQDQANGDWVSDVPNRPQLSNVKGWIRIFATKLSSKSRQRAYLRTMWEKAWDLAVHLQHDSNAVEQDADLAVNAANFALETFTTMRLWHEHKEPEKCPSCDSLRYSRVLDINEDGEYVVWDECSACGYATEPTPDEPEPEADEE